jgi:hypothetical protein
MIKNIVSKDFACMRQQLISLMKEKRYFQCDICTGNYKIDCDTTNIVCPPEKAFDFFAVYFGDKCFVRQVSESDDGAIKAKNVRLRREELRSIFNTIGEIVTYNSRLDEYHAIPEWDGVPRIDTFMRDVFQCTANPNLFRLYLTSIIGMMADPENTYVPYFFDFVGRKGVGKTYLHTMLMGAEHVLLIEPTSRPEDVCAQIYSRNTIIAIDDECVMTGGGTDKRFGWSEDKLKSFVTRSVDVFSRKFMQPETRRRSFVFVRTSNAVKSSTDPDERRQIIFESGLPPKTTRLFAYGKENYVQLLAEAKAYYAENGVYKLNAKDWDDITRQQAEYFNDETTYYAAVRKFVDHMYNQAKVAPHLCKLQTLQGKRVIQWKDWEEYRVNEQTDIKQSISGTLFWKIMRGLEAKGAPIRISDERYSFKNGSRAMFAYLYSEKDLADL